MNQNSKHIKILERLLKLPDNKECADCRSKAPRWASINLGIFICLQCSGIHRSLGVHISKVRSTTLDSWLPEQVSYMQSMGNYKSNAYWEAELPLRYDRSQIENFIHAKYVEKRWITEDCKVKSPSKPKQELISSRSLRCYGSNELTPSRSSRIYGNNGLTSSRSSRRYGSIAEWTNSQHLFKERKDFLVGEKDRASSRPDNGEVPKDHGDSKNQLQHLKKKENCQPSTVQSAKTDLKSVHGKPLKESEPAQVVSTRVANGSLRKSEQEGLKTEPSTANVLHAVPSPKVDYADELFKTLFVDDSVKNDSSTDSNEWVRFDSDQESSTPEAKTAPKAAVEKAFEAKLTSKSAASDIKNELKKEDIQTAKVPFTTGQLNEHQKDVINNKQNLSEKPNMISSSSIHLQRLGMLAQRVSSSDAPKVSSNVSGFDHQLNVNGRNVEHTTGTQMPMNFQPVKSAVNSAPHTMSSLYRPAPPFKGVTTMPSARDSPAALPVSGYDYDFSNLTRGMFPKRR